MKNQKMSGPAKRAKKYEEIKALPKEQRKKKFEELMLKYEWINKDYFHLIDNLFENDASFEHYLLFDILFEEIECNASNKELKKIYRQYIKINLYRGE